MPVESTHPNLDGFVAGRPVLESIASDYHTALDSVLRWQDGVLPLDKVETDKDHVDRSLGILREIGDEIPEIASELSFRTAAEIIYVHDAGEIVAKDLARSHPDFDILKPVQKRKERLAFWLLSGKYIADPVLRDNARELFDRYDNYDPTDKEATIAKLVDKLQAMRFAKRYVYKDNQLKFENDIARVRSAGLIAEFGGNLIAQVSPPVKAFLLEFLNFELRDYYGDEFDSGHVKEARRVLVNKLWE